MKLKKIIPAFAIIAGLFLAMATSGFKEGANANVNPYFYKYKLATFAQTDIQNPANYVRSSSGCGGSYDVCGVLLTIDKGTGNPPDASDFGSQSANLWNSQQGHGAVGPNIQMQH